MDRRTLLTRGTALAAVALAGCTTDEDPSPPTEPDGSGDGGDGSDGDGGDGDGNDGGGNDGDGSDGDGNDGDGNDGDGNDGGNGDGDDGGDGGDTTQETTTTTGDETGTTTAETTTTTDDGSGAPPSSVEVSVGADGARFDPETFEVQVGGTVTWVWEGSGHNVRPSSQPDGATWSGTEGGDGTTYNSGHTYEYTFAVAGEYEYYCAPHRTFGMTGSFTVVE